jgi:copper(I)-binding protein
LAGGAALAGGSTRRRATTGLALALTAALALSGCAAGQRAQTSSQHSTVDGSSADVGQISLRNAGLAAPITVAGYRTGQTAQLQVDIVNNGDANDTLTSVTTSAAKSVAVSSTPPITTLDTTSDSSDSSSPSSTPSDTSVPSTGNSSTAATPSDSAAGSSSAESSDSASSSPAAPASQPLTIPANTLVRVGTGKGASITLDELSGGLIAGQTIMVTFTFQNAGTVTLPLSVKLMADSTGGQTVDIEPSTED